MNRNRWLILTGALLALAIVAVVVFFLPRPSAPSPPTSLSPSAASSPTLTFTALPPTIDWSDLPTVTPPGPGEPTLPAAALAMQAAPTATPSPIPPPPSSTPAPTPTPTPVPATGSDDVPMVEVPAGEFLMGLTRQQADAWFNDSPIILPSMVYDQIPQLTVYLDTFAIDQIEVTNAYYRRCVEADVCPSSFLVTEPTSSHTPIGYATNPQYNDYPVIVTWDQAYAYCQWVGKRLPTEAEWEKAARGTDGRRYPWGNEWYEHKTSKPTHVEDLEPVGQRPEGASPYGILNMGGNAYEWVADQYGPYLGNTLNVLFAHAQDYKVYRGVVRGWGSTTFRDASRPEDPYYHLIGFRCVQGPKPVSLTKAVRSTSLLPTPVPLADIDFSRVAYVPDGEFIMGTNEWKGHQVPEHIVYLDACYIDQYEVTVAEFVEFLNTLEEHRYACDNHDCVQIRPDGNIWSGTEVEYANDCFRVVSGAENRPVIFETWYGAYAYCRWRGGRLPTEAEWEKAARGTDGRKYPWGNEWEPDRAAHIPEGHYTAADYPLSIGTHPGDVSPYGVFDMLGNAPEWVSDWFDSTYYTHSPHANPVGPEVGNEFDGYHVERGARAIFGQQSFGIMGRAVGVPPGFGFRCVYPVDLVESE